MTESVITAETPDTLESRLRDALAPGLLLVREIGAGGMARVFLAREPALKRLVAVKVLSGDLAANAASRARFEREAQAVAQLSHPNIVAIHTVGELSDKTPYFVMQFVEGRSMADRIKAEGTLNVAEARRIIGEVAAALAVAHAQGIIHRDVKPANILYEDSTGRSLVSDFGIAAMSADPSPLQANMRLTGTGMIVGTPQYMSPEQLLAEPVTEKTDVYSLGLLAHELLVGAGPFKASSPHELIAAHLRDTPARLSTLRPDVDAEFEEIVSRCLQKDSTRRPAAAEVAQRLAPGGTALLEWPPPGLDYLHGRLRWLANPWVLGSLLILLTLQISLVSGTQLASAAASPATVLLLLGALVGIGALIEGLRRASRLGKPLGSAARHGYAWMTLLETMADTRGDTGNIVTGSREYASLTLAHRARWRLLRVAREMAWLATGVLTLPVLALYLVVGSAAGSAQPVAWIVPTTVLTLAALSIAGGVAERLSFARRRTRRKSSTDVEVARLAGPWNESFERARDGQPIGRGPRGGAITGKLGTAALIIVGILAIVNMIPLVIVATLGPGILTSPTNANARLRIQQTLSYRDFALPKDSGISAIAAGRAYHQIVRTGRDAPHPRFPEHEIPSLPRPFWRDSLPGGLFPTARDPRQFAGTPEFSRIIAAARAGFTTAELAWLERMARDPAWRAWDTLARATQIDFSGARFRFPLSDSVTGWWDFPEVLFAPAHEMAHLSASRAAWHLARGRRDSAEAVLRQTIAAGLTLAVGGFTIVEQNVGATIARVGRQSLQDLWERTGDPRARELRLRVDATNAVGDALAESGRSLFVGVSNRDTPALRAAMVRFAADSTEPRGLRFEVLVWLAITPCTNLRELVFGYAPDVRGAFDAAERNLARTGSDSARIALVRQTSERLYMYDRSTQGFPFAWARFAGRMLFNPRLEGCTRLALFNV